MDKFNELNPLDLEQVKNFDTEYVTPERYVCLTRHLKEDLEISKESSFNFIDMGGGNGRFTDKLLEDYPNANAILIDASPYMAEINLKHPRKKVITDSVENIENYEFKNIEIVFLNWVLHHLVSCNYKKSRENICKVLEILHRNKNIRHIIVFENMYDGILFDNLPGKLIYFLTSLKWLKRIIRKMGANTAGVGVCFLSKKAWEYTFRNTGFNIVFTEEFSVSKMPFYKKLPLHIYKSYKALFFLK